MFAIGGEASVWATSCEGSVCVATGREGSVCGDWLRG